jgi:hypothetical protein
MTIHKLYEQYQEGTITKSKFLYEVRKQELPYLSKFNSFEDTITILKNKHHLKEAKEKNPELPTVDCKTIDMVSPYEYSKGMNFELKIETDSFGQNTPKTEEVLKAQKKVLRNLSKNPYYYTQKLMTDEEKKYEKGNEREYELKKQMIHNSKKGLIRESRDISDSDLWDAIDRVRIPDAIERLGLTQEDLLHPEAWEQIQDELDYNAEMNEEIDENCGCEDQLHSIGEDKEIDRINMDIKDVASQLVREWSLTEADLEDEDIMAELQEACNAKYKEMLNEMEEDEGTIEVDDEMKAKQLADQGINVKLNKKI